MQHFSIKSIFCALSLKIFTLLIFFNFVNCDFQLKLYAETGSLKLHYGSFKLMRAGKSSVYTKTGVDYRLNIGDRLHTGKKTKVTLFLNNRDESINLFSKSFFELDDVSKELSQVALLVGKGDFSVKPAVKQSETVKTASENTKGQNKDKSGNEANITQPAKKSKIKSLKRRTKKRFKVRTVSAVIGVRGTKFVIAATEDSTHLLTLTGEVVLSSQEIPDYEMDVIANKISKVSEGTGPSLPLIVTPEQQQQILQSEANDAFNKVEFGPAEPVGALQQRLKNGDSTPQYEIKLDTENQLLEQLDRIDLLENMVETAENKIDAAKNKNLVLTMTFQNR